MVNAYALGRPRGHVVERWPDETVGEPVETREMALERRVAELEARNERLEAVVVKLRVSALRGELRLEALRKELRELQQYCPVPAGRA